MASWLIPFLPCLIAMETCLDDPLDLMMAPSFLSLTSASASPCSLPSSVPFSTIIPAPLLQQTPIYTARGWCPTRNKKQGNSIYIFGAKMSLETEGVVRSCGSGNWRQESRVEESNCCRKLNFPCRHLVRRALQGKRRVRRRRNKHERNLIRMIATSNTRLQ